MDLRGKEKQYQSKEAVIGACSHHRCIWNGGNGMMVSYSSLVVFYCDAVMLLCCDATVCYMLLYTYVISYHTMIMLLVVV